MESASKHHELSEHKKAELLKEIAKKNDRIKREGDNDKIARLLNRIEEIKAEIKRLENSEKK